MSGDDDVLEAFKAAVEKQRGYADFFHWHDKTLKESGILDDFREAAAQAGLEMSDCAPSPPGQDPPDGSATFAGRKISIELTEFVDAVMIQKAKATGEAPWRWWTEDEAVGHLKRIVASKDHAEFGAGSDYWVVIHCDEQALDHALLRRYISSAGAIEVRGINRCFMLLSYDPKTQRKPLLEVAVSRAA